jgi:hypothetical protein
MSKDRKIAYEPHPVSPERKADLVKAGYKIIDARFAPADALPVGETEADAHRDNKATDDAGKAELAEARADYEAKLGKRPFPGWDAKTLREKMAAA